MCKDIPLEVARQLFIVVDGKLINRATCSVRQTRKGTEAGSLNKRSGYRGVCINQENYRAHRVIFALVTGEQPSEIDHINGDKADNRIENLRASNRSSNLHNASMSSTNTSGVNGVSYMRTRRKYVAYITLNQRRIHLGLHCTIEQAKQARLEAEQRYGVRP